MRYPNPPLMSPEVRIEGTCIIREDQAESVFIEDDGDEGFLLTCV